MKKMNAILLSLLTLSGVAQAATCEVYKLRTPKQGWIEQLKAEAVIEMTGPDTELTLGQYRTEIEGTGIVVAPSLVGSQIRLQVYERKTESLFVTTSENIETSFHSGRGYDIAVRCHSQNSKK